MSDKADNNLFCCHMKDHNYNGLLNGEFNENKTVFTLGHRQFNKCLLLEEISYVLTNIRKQWILIQNLVLRESNPPFSDILQSRLGINQGLNAVLQVLYEIPEANKEKPIIAEVFSLSAAILPLNIFEEKILMKLCYSLKQRDSCPLYEYFHCYMDIQLYILLIRLKAGCSKIMIEESIKKTIESLCLLTKIYFTKEFSTENTSFVCPCVGNFWRTIYTILEEKFAYGKFWEHLRLILKDDNALFSFWLLKDLVIDSPRTAEGTKQSIISNYNFVKDKFEASLGTSDDYARHLKMLYAWISELWPGEKQLEFLLILWDYFSKRLNISSKYKPDVYIRCDDFSELLDTIIYNPRDCEDEFEIFIGLLHNYLSRNQNNWAKVKCRIFSQLSPFKIGNLDEVGVIKVFELLMGLMQVNEEELSKRIATVYGSLKENMITSSTVNIYISFIIRMVRENKSIEKISSPLTKVMQDSSGNQKYFHIIKEFFNGFHQIVKFSKSMQLQQWMLFDQWCIKYLATCYFCDLEDALKTLIFLVRRISLEEVWSYWEGTFKEYIYPALKQIGNNSSCSPLVGELVGEISRLSPDIVNDSFSFFTAECVNYKLTEKYLCVILKTYPLDVYLTQIQEKIAVQCWVRISLYSTQNYEEITVNIMKLESMPSFIKNGVKNYSDPLVNLIEIIGFNKNLFIGSSVLSRFCEMCFENLDLSLTIHLPQIKNEMVILRIYTCLSIALLQCNTLLYDRHKTSSPATKLISCLLFPTEFMMGKISHPFSEAIKKTWHLYFESLLKLGQDDDPYIQRTLRDLISKYIPHYSVSESPIYLCLVRENSAKIILEKINTIYFRHPTKENEQHVMKALKILCEYVKSSTSVGLLRIVVKETMFGLCEIYIFHSHKNLALNIILYIVTCPFYNELKDEVVKSLLFLTGKHLAFNSKMYFGLINILAKTIPTEILTVKETIVEKIKDIEKIRGIGYDENLRSYLNSLNSALTVINSQIK